MSSRGVAANATSAGRNEPMRARRHASKADEPREAEEEWAKRNEETTAGKNRIMIYGPKADGTYVVEFTTVDAESLAISIREAAVIQTLSGISLILVSSPRLGLRPARQEADNRSKKGQTRPRTAVRLSIEAVVKVAAQSATSSGNLWRPHLFPKWSPPTVAHPGHHVEELGHDDFEICANGRRSGAADCN